MICKCGHPEEEHVKTDGGYDMCADCNIDPDIDVLKLYSHHFIPDNLNTIEYEAKKRNLI